MATKSKIPSAAIQKRIMKTGEVTDADVEQYIKQVGVDTLQSMNLNLDNVKEYLKNVTELGNKPKKKLPSKTKIESGDSTLVVDKEDKVYKVAVKSKKDKKEKESLGDSEPEQPKEKITFKSLAKKAAGGTLDLGSAAFNKMFPNIGKFMGFVQNKLDNQSKAAVETSNSVKGYSREVQYSSTLLDSIIQSGDRSNQILQQILNAAGSGSRQSSGPAAASSGPNVSLGNGQSDNRRNNRTGSQQASGPAGSGRTPKPGRNTAIVATAAAAVVGTGAVLAYTARNRETPVATQERSVPAGATPVITNGRVVGYIPEGGGPTITFDDADRQELESARSSVATATVATPLVAAPPVAAPSAAPVVATPAAPVVATPAAAPAAAVAATNIEGNDLQRLPNESTRDFNRRVTDQQRSLLENRPATPVAAPVAAQERSVPAGATPVITNGRVVGYIPEGGGPTITFDDADRQVLESARSSVATPITPVAATARTAPAATSVETPSTLSFDTRLLHIKAKEIIFKADRFEYSQDASTAAANTPIPSSPPPPISGGGSPSSSAAPPATAAGNAGTTSNQQPSAGGSGGATQTTAANLSGLNFARGVDQRINPGIAEKTKQVQSAFGKSLSVTSGYRDAARNAEARGASKSTHMTKDAVDIQFQGNEQDTVNLIKIASEKGMQGIGVYRPGFVHLDTGAKRVWGPNFLANSIPQVPWAAQALNEHMGRSSAAAGDAGAAGSTPDATAVPSQSAGSEGGGESSTPSATGGGGAQDAMPVETQAASAGGGDTSSMESSVPPSASPVPSSPSSGVAMSQASTADEVATRTPASPAPVMQNTSSPSASSPSPSLPSIDPNNPGDVEPPDAALRYSRLFNMAA